MDQFVGCKNFFLANYLRELAARTQRLLLLVHQSKDGNN